MSQYRCSSCSGKRQSRAETTAPPEMASPDKKIPAVPKDHEETPLWALTDSNRRPSACKADALNQLS